MTAILGVSAFYHDSAAALVVDGRIVAAAQEERFSRKKHDPGFPKQALDYCLSQAGLSPEKLDLVVFYEKPLRKFDRLLETWLAFAPLGFRAFARAVPLWARQKLRLPRELDRGLDRGYRKRYLFAEHHLSHAASAFYPSPFDQAAILTFDGVGEWATAGFGTGAGNRIRLSHELRFPHSLGLLYSAFTYHCGFKVNSGEYKLMGLAPYGEPRYAAAIRRHLIDLKADGSFRLDQSYFAYCHGRTMTSRKFARLFGGPPRRPEDPLTQREMDLAASIQQITEEILLSACEHLKRRSGLKNLCLAGGVALNCTALGRILRQGPFERIWIQPAAGDAGGALGAALLAWHQWLGNPRRPEPDDSQQGSLLGPAYDCQAVRRALVEAGAVFEPCPDESALLERVAGLLAAGQVVGWMQGRLEFGPRALGCRSILGDPRDAAMRSRIGRKIKFREPFRPLAPAVLEERVADYFELQAQPAGPYMLLVAPLAAARLKPLDQAERGLRGLAMLSAVRSDIPAVTHVDNSARVQTVDVGRHGRFQRLLARFEQVTGCPVLINTSFNVRGEPIVCSPQDALRCFLATDMDALVIEDFLLHKASQPLELVQRAAGYPTELELD